MAIESGANASSLPSSTGLALDRTLMAHERTLMADDLHRAGIVAAGHDTAIAVVIRQ